MIGFYKTEYSIGTPRMHFSTYPINTELIDLDSHLWKIDMFIELNFKHRKETLKVRSENRVFGVYSNTMIDMPEYPYDTNPTKISYFPVEKSNNNYGYKLDDYHLIFIGGPDNLQTYKRFSCYTFLK